MLRTVWSNLRKLALNLSLVGGGTLLLAASAEAASVYNCSANGEKCVVKVEEGIIGDRVKVLDEKARVIAVGRITKRRGAYAVVSISQTSQTIRKGDPVIVDVDNRDSNLQYAASFSGKD
jgi:hypothetical protein